MRSWVVVALALLRATPRCAAGEARGGGAGFHIVSRLASETEDVLQPLFALLRSAERGAVDIRRGAIRKDKLTAAVFVDGAAALRAAAALAPRFPWCDFRRDAQADQAARAEATAAAKAGRTVVVTDVVGTVFQGSLARLAADGAARVYTTARVGAAATPPNLTAVPCSIVAALRCAEAGACTTVFPPGAFAASDAARHRYHLGAAACQQVVFDGGCKARTDAFGAVVAGCGLGVVPVVHGVGARASDCKWAAAVWAQYEVGQAHRAANTNAKTRKKWAALGLGEERFGDRERLAVEAQIAMPDLFTSDFSAPNCSASAGAKRRDVIFTVYNYPDAATLYFFLRSLRGAGCVSDVVVFTHKAHAELRAVAEAYGATCLEYFAPLTGNAQVASIMARPHMQALKKDFPGRLIKNYKFTFMYCYLLEFGQKFQRAAFMDVRDVYFQRDPFQAAACRGLTASTETAALSVYDRRLIHSDHYPLHCDTRWAEFQGVPPINSGVFIADVDTMMGLVHQTDAILEKCGAGYDQGTFTELVYLRQIRAPVTLHTTEHGPIAMICNSLSVQIDAYGTVVNERGDAYAVVHQFDRFDELNALVARTMPYDASKFREACKSPAPRP